MVSVHLVNRLYCKVMYGVVREVEMSGYVNCFLVEYVGSVVVNSDVELLGRYAYVLFLAFRACYDVY